MQVYVNTMSAEELLKYFLSTENYTKKKRKGHEGVHAGLDRRILCILSVV